MQMRGGEQLYLKWKLSCKMSEKDSRPAEPEQYLYQSLPRAYTLNVEATQWPSLLSGVLDSEVAG